MDIVVIGGTVRLPPSSEWPSKVQFILFIYRTRIIINLHILWLLRLINDKNKHPLFQGMSLTKQKAQNSTFLIP